MLNLTHTINFLSTKCRIRTFSRLYTLLQIDTRVTSAKIISYDRQQLADCVVLLPIISCNFALTMFYAETRCRLILLLKSAFHSRGAPVSRWQCVIIVNVITSSAWLMLVRGRTRGNAVFPFKLIEKSWTEVRNVGFLSHHVLILRDTLSSFLVVIIFLFSSFVLFIVNYNFHSSLLAQNSFFFLFTTLRIIFQSIIYFCSLLMISQI